MPAIRFYDGEIEATRDATQDDFDMLLRKNVEKYRDICKLQRLLESHGIPLPDGVRHRRDPVERTVRIVFEPPPHT